MATGFWLAFLNKSSYTFVATTSSGYSVQCTWKDQKNRTNKRDHGLSFETARLVFNDPLMVSRRDPHSDGDRWQTMGMAGSVLLFVVHTWPEPIPETGEEIIHIISARKATKHERKAYEEGKF